MKELYNLQIDEDNIKVLLEENPFFTDEDVISKINILKKYDLNYKYIISSNSTFLTIDDNNIIELIEKLKELNFDLNIIEYNPCILNIYINNFNDYINDNLKIMSIDKIREILEENLELFNYI